MHNYKITIKRDTFALTLNNYARRVYRLADMIDSLGGMTVEGAVVTVYRSVLIHGRFEGTDQEGVRTRIERAIAAVEEEEAEKQEER